MAQGGCAVHVELDGDRRALARAAHRRAHVRRQLGELLGSLRPAVRDRLAVVAEAELDSAWSARQVPVRRPAGEHADDQREQAVQQDLADPCGRREAGFSCHPWEGCSTSAGVARSGSDAALWRPAARLRRRRSAHSQATAARAAPRRAGAARACRPGAASVQRWPRRNSQPPSRQPLTSTAAAPSRSAYSTKEGGSRPVHIRLKVATSGAASVSTRAPRSQPNTTIGCSPSSAASACCRPRRSAPIGELRHVDAGDQFGRAAERRGRRAGADADAAARAQVGVHLGHLAADALVGVRHHGHGRIGAVVEAAPAAVAVGRVDHGDGHRRGALRHEGQREQQHQRCREQHHTKAAELASTSGCTNSSSQSNARAPGTWARSAGAWLMTGCTTASSSKRGDAARASARGGNTAARLMRWMWNHRPNTSSSGTPRWMKTSSENRRSLTDAASRKLRVSGVAKSGSAVQPFGGGDGRELAELVPVQPEAADRADEGEQQQRHAGQPGEAAEAAVVAEQPFAQQVRQHHQHEGVGGVAVQAAQHAAQVPLLARQLVDGLLGALRPRCRAPHTGRCR